MKTIPGWKYYNHCAIANTQPHETPPIEPLQNGEIWRINGHPYFALWTTDFDCGYDTGWWYIIRDEMISIDKIKSAHSRNSIRRALKKVDARMIDPFEYESELYRVYVKAFSRYKNAPQPVSQDLFRKGIRPNEEYWGAFSKESGVLIGYCSTVIHDDCAVFSSAKYDADYMKLQASEALTFAQLEEYLTIRNLKYISNGQRTISHETSINDFFEHRFDFRKAYCKLHLAYKPGIGAMVRILYPFRKILYIFKKLRIVHNLLSILIDRKSTRLNSSH